MKKKLLISVLLTTVIVIFFIYPRIEFKKDGYLYLMSYSKNWEESEDIGLIENQMCYDESYSYDEKRNISVIDWEYKNIWFFKWFKIKYQKGNICSKEYLLEETYIRDFLERAIIEDNPDNIDLSKLIKGKKAIVGNDKYDWNDNYHYLGYELDGKYQEMYIYNNDNLIIVQIGNRDEGAKFIAYE